VPDQRVAFFTTCWGKGKGEKQEKTLFGEKTLSKGERVWDPSIPLIPSKKIKPGQHHQKRGDKESHPREKARPRTDLNWPKGGKRGKTFTREKKEKFQQMRGSEKRLFFIKRRAKTSEKSRFAIKRWR